MAWNPKTGRWELDTNLQGLTPQQKTLMESYNSGDTNTYRSAIGNSGLTNSSPASGIGGWSGEDFTATPGGLAASAIDAGGKNKSWFDSTMDFMSSESGNNLLGNITMGANLLTKAIMLPTAIENMELQNKALNKNIEIAQYGLDKSRRFSNALAAAPNNTGLAERAVS